MNRYRNAIQIQPSFHIALFLFFIFGYIHFFFMLLLFVTLHELTHVLVGLRYGCKLRRIHFFAFGEAAELSRVEMLSPAKRIKMLLAGPFLNLILGTVFLFIRACFAPDSELLLQIVGMNYVFCFFNLLPVCPLDGGRICHILIGNAKGVLNAAVVMNKVTRITGGLFIALGTVQVILFPLNISLLCIGIFLLLEGKKSIAQNTADLFLYAYVKREKIEQCKMMPTKILTVDSDLTLFELIKWITWDHYSVFYVYENGNIKGSMTETEVLALLTDDGGSSRCGDVF